jgi:hypothetical protein
MNEMRMMIIVATCMLGLARPAIADPITVIDQMNSPPIGSFFSGQSIIGQSFVPSLAGIDAIEFELGALSFLENSVFVNLRDGVSGANGLGGPILGTTAAIVIPGDSPIGTRHFDFPSRIALVPGNVYAAEIVGTAGVGFSGSFTRNDLYPPGQSLVILDPDEDLVFAEGLHVPEPATLFAALEGVTLLNLVFVRRRRPARGKPSAGFAPRTPSRF